MAGRASLLPPPPRDDQPIQCLRSWMWYCHARWKTGFSEYKLQHLLVDDGSSVDKTTRQKKRLLKTLREGGWISPPHQKTRFRSFDMVERLAMKVEVCQESLRIYHSPLWRWLEGEFPDFEEMHARVSEAIARRGYSRTSEEQRDRWEEVPVIGDVLNWPANCELALYFDIWRPDPTGTPLADVEFTVSLFVEAALCSAYLAMERWRSFAIRYTRRLAQRAWMSPREDSLDHPFVRAIVARLLDYPPRPSRPSTSELNLLLARPALDVRSTYKWLLKNKAGAAVVYSNLFNEPKAVRLISFLIVMRWREELLNLDWPTSEQIGHWLQIASSQAVSHVAGLRADGYLLGVWSARTQTYVHPPCQFDEGCRLLPAMRSLLAILPTSGDDDGWRRTFWLYGSRPQLGEHAPAELLASEPDRVLKFAMDEVGYGA